MNLTILLSLVVAVTAVYVLKQLMEVLALRKAGRRALTEGGKRALVRLPEHITLARVESPAWRDAAAIEQQTAPLLHEGFTDLGAYRVDKTPEVLIRILFQPQTYVAAHIYDHPTAGSWIEFATRYTDGSSHTLSTMPPTGMQQPDWIRKIQADRSTPTDQLYYQFRTQREWHGIKPVEAAEVIHEFEDGYMRHMSWRQNTGISPEEVAQVALKWVKKKQQAHAAGTIG